MGRLARRRRARRGGRCCRSGRPTGTARPTSRASAFAAWPGLLAEPARAGDRGRASSTSASATRTGSRTGSRSPARRGRRPGALRPRVGARCARYAAERGVQLIGDVPIYVAAGLGRPARAPGALPRRRGGGHAAGRLHRQGPAVGQPALRLAGAAAARLPLVDRAACGARSSSSTSRGSTTSAASSPTGRCRAARAHALRRALEARAGPRAVRRRARGARRAAADRRGPRRDHARRSSGCATRSGCPGMVVLQFGFTPTEPHNVHARRRTTPSTRSSTPAPTTTTRSAAGTSRSTRRRARAGRRRARPHGVRERRAAVGADPARVRLPARVAMVQVAGRARPRHGGADEPAGRAAGAWGWRLSAARGAAWRGACGRPTEAAGGCVGCAH